MLNRVTEIDNKVLVQRALISVSDKTGLESFVQELWSLLPDLVVYSTGGTYDRLLGIAPPHRLVAVSDYTGQPEMQGGLVKTLDFKLYLGILSETYNESHQQDLVRTAAVPLDLIVVNLYPFEKAVSSPQVTLEDARSHIDIGGPCLLRASAKNFLRVASVCDPVDYPAIIQNLKAGQGTLGCDFRLRLAKKVFHHTANYDGAISNWLAGNATDLAELYQFHDEESVNP